MKGLGIIFASLLLAVVAIVPVYAIDMLCDGGVLPLIGDNWTLFTYTVWWTGESSPPDAYVHIDGDYTGIMMVLFDHTVEGYLYRYQTRLGSGDHDFYFTDEYTGRDPNQGEGEYMGPQVE